MILAIFYLQVAPILTTKFLVNWPFSSGEAKIDFSMFSSGGQLVLRRGTILAISVESHLGKKPVKFD